MDTEFSNDTARRMVTFTLELGTDSNVGPLRRIQGLVRLKDIIDLITQEELLANPRRPKKSAITQDIMETLTTRPEMMPFSSKGLLGGVSTVETRQGNKYELYFSDPHLEGIIDGGHNLMAIALVSLMAAGVPEAEIRKIKFWDELKKCWKAHLSELTAWKREGSDPLLGTLIPVEIVAPHTDRAGIEGDQEFKDLSLQICANRNQNAQLATDAMANQAGVFDFLKASLPEEIASEVTWSTNDNKRINPRDLIALTWVALGKVPTLSKYGVSALPPTAAYSNKAKALDRFTSLVTANDASEKTIDGRSYVILDSYIADAFDMTLTIMKCYDIINEGFKDAYNATGGSFGRIGAVKKSSKGKHYTLLTNKLIDHEVPPAGFLMPVIFSLQAFIDVDEENERLFWILDPVEFFSDKKNLQIVVEALRSVMQIADWNPQTVGKNAAAYNAAYDKARTMILEAQRK